MNKICLKILYLKCFMYIVVVSYTPPEKLIINDADIPPCPVGWDYQSQINQCLYSSPYYMTWDDANDYCHNITGGELASILSEFEYNNIRKYSQKYSPAYPTWIGLFNRKDVSFNSYRWTDGNYYNLTKWLPGEPVNPKTSCFAFKTLDTENGYKGIPCKYRQPFVCKQHSANCLSSIYNGTNGTVQSSNYPNDYDNNLNCYYHIIVPDGMIINVTINDFYTDPLDDLYIYDGPNDDSYLIMRLWGYTVRTGNYFESTDNQLTLRFVTNYRNVDRGWKFSWQAIPPQPTNTYTAMSGIITSPNYPDDYDKHTNKLYLITVPDGYIIDFYITDLVTENNYDYLRIANGNNPRNLDNMIVQLSSNLTGNGTVPEHFYSSSNIASMLFYADMGVSKKGWSLTYNAILG